MSEGPVENAGRLEIPLESDVAGYVRELRAKLKAETANLAVKVGIEVSEAGLREQLEATVEAAAAGVKAKVGVDVDERGLRSRLAAVFGRGRAVNVPVEGDSKLTKDVAEASAEAQAEAEAAPVEVPVKADNRLRAALLRMIAEARAEQQVARGIEVPVKVKGFSGRMLARGSFYGAIISLIQPAVSAISGLGSGLVAMLGPLGQTTGVLGAVPGLITSFVTAMGAGKMATGQFSEALKANQTAQQLMNKQGRLTEAEAARLREALGARKGIGSSVLEAADAVNALTPAWKRMRAAVGERFFRPFANDIMQTGRVLIPMLRRGLVATSTTMGTFVDQFMQWVRSPEFGRDFPQVLDVGNEGLNAMRQAFLDVAHATVDLIIAARPLSRMVNGWITDFGSWLRTSAATGRETGRLSDFLERAGHRAEQFGRIIRDMSRGLFGIFKGGMDLGSDATASLEDNMRRFAEWANSGAGQESIRAWFEDMRPIFYEAIGLIGDIFQGLGRMSRDKDTAALLHQIRTELGPAVEEFLTVLGGNLGPKVIDFLSSAANAFANLGEAGGGISEILGMLDRLLDWFNAFTDAYPAAGTMLGKLLGYFIAFKALKTVGRLTGLTVLTRGLTALGAAAVIKGLGVLRSLVGMGGLRDVLSGGGRTRGGRTRNNRSFGSIFRDAFSKRMEVWWKTPMPVVVVNRGATPVGGGNGGDYYGTGNDRDSRKRNPANRRVAGNAARRAAEREAEQLARAGRGGRFGRILGGLGGLLGLGGGAAATGAGRSLLGRAGGLLAKGGRGLMRGGIGGILGYLGADYAAGKLDNGKGGWRDRIAGGIRGAAAGAGIGSMVGMLGGPFAPITAPVGAAAGGVIGGGIGLMQGQWGKVGAFVKKQGAKIGPAFRKAAAESLRAFPIVGPVVEAVTKIVPAIRRGLSAVPRTFSGAFNAAKGPMMVALNGMTGGAAGAIVKLVGNVRRIGPQVKAALRNPGGLLRAAGVSIINGLTFGLASRMGHLRRTLSGITNFIREHKGPAPVDRALLRPAGRRIMEGLNVGLVSGIPPIFRTLRRTTNQIRTQTESLLAARTAAMLNVGGAGRDRFGLMTGGLTARDKAMASVERARAKALKGSTDAIRAKATASAQAARAAIDLGKNTRLSEATVEAAEKARQKATDAIQEATDRARQALEERQSYIQDLKSSLTEPSTMGGLAGKGITTARQAVNGLQFNLKRLRQFAGNLAALRRKGLSADAISQLAQGGVEGSGSLAANLARAGRGTIDQVNRLQSKVSKVAGGLATNVGGDLYNAGVRAADGILDGLRAKSGDIDKAVAKAAAQTSAAAKRAASSGSGRAARAAARNTRPTAGASTKNGKVLRGSPGKGARDFPGPKKHGDTTHITVNNPVPERASESVPVVLRRKAFVLGTV